MGATDLSKFCTPSLVYFVLSVIALVLAVMKKFQPVSLIVKVVWVMFWTWFLNFLCSKGYSGISWFLVLLPFILTISVMVLALEMARQAH